MKEQITKQLTNEYDINEFEVLKRSYIREIEFIKEIHQEVCILKNILLTTDYVDIEEQIQIISLKLQKEFLESKKSILICEEHINTILEDMFKSANGLED